MNKPSTSLVIAVAITSTIALTAVLAMAVFSSQSDGIGAYAGGVGEIFIILMVVGFTIGALTLLVLRRKGS